MVVERGLLLALGLSALVVSPLRAADISSCVWSHVGGEDKTAIADAYHRASVAGTDLDMTGLDRVMSQNHQALQSAFKLCESVGVVSEDKMDGFLRLIAIRENAAADIEASPLVFRRPLTRKQLDDAWAEAPNNARRCLLAVYANTLTRQGISGLKRSATTICDDDTSPNWFIRHFTLRGREIVVARQMLMFMLAEAGIEDYQYGDNVVER